MGQICPFFEIRKMWAGFQYVGNASRVKEN